MVKEEKKHTYTIDEKGGYKNPQPPILDLQCSTGGARCHNLEEVEGGEGGEDEGQRLRGRVFHLAILVWYGGIQRGYSKRKDFKGEESEVLTTPSSAGAATKIS